MLDNDAKPILERLSRGDRPSIRLDSGEQRLLATWAVKTALVLDTSTSTPSIAAGIYSEFRLERSPAGAHTVAIGGYLGTTRVAWATLHPLRLNAADEPLGYVATILVGRLVLQVIGHFAAGGAQFVDNRRVGTALTYIWPQQAPIAEWPSNGLAFNDDSLDTLSEGIRLRSR